jgi:glycosyltransferase involved in cell wall biosynthesis
MKKTIAIVDTLWAGHHPTYFKLFCEIAIGCGHKVVALSPAVAEMTAWKDQNKYTSAQLEILSCSEIIPLNFPLKIIGSLLTTGKRWLNVRTTLQGINPDLVFFPWLDSYLNVFLFPCIHKMIFPFVWSGIYFHPVFLRVKSANRLRQMVRETTVKIFKSDRCLGVAVLDEGISLSLQQLIGCKPVTVIPDIADDSAPDSDYEVVKKIKANAQNRKIVLLAGSLEKRKGFLTLLETASQSPAEGFFFVFAGKMHGNTFSEKELSLIERLATAPPDNCFFLFQEIPGEAQFNALIAMSDVVFACYDHFPHSSNMLSKAALFKKPLIVSNRYCMGAVVEKYGIGATIEEGDHRGCIKAIKALIERKIIVDDICFVNYLTDHAISTFTDKFIDLLPSQPTENKNVKN